VGSFSIVPIGTYAASTNFHQLRDTTGQITGSLNRQRQPSSQGFSPVRAMHGIAQWLREEVASELAVAPLVCHTKVADY
jgi:hypothetical protein